MTPMLRKQYYLLYVIAFQVLVGFGIVVPLFPYIVRELGGTSFHMGLMVTAWAGAQFLFSTVWGSLSDRIGRRPVLLVGLVGYIVAFGVIAIATNLWQIMLARFLGGALSAATIPSVMAIIADTSHPDERSTQMARIGAVMNTGFLAGPAIGGLLASAGLGHRGAAGTAAVLAVFTWILAFFTLPEPAGRSAKKEAAKRLSGVRTLLRALVGPDTLLYLLVFATSFGGAALFSMTGLLLIDRMGASESMIGLALTVEGLVAASSQALLVGRLPGWLGEVKAIRWLLLAGAFGFLVLGFSFGYVQAFGGVILIAISLSCIRPLNLGMAANRTSLAQGVTMGLQTSFDALGRSLGPLWAGMIYLWQDWSPFVSSALLFVLFFLWVSASWRDGVYVKVTKPAS